MMEAWRAVFLDISVGVAVLTLFRIASHLADIAASARMVATSLHVLAQIAIDKQDNQEGLKP